MLKKLLPKLLLCLPLRLLLRQLRLLRQPLLRL
jgi:hypothetical protein